MFHSGPSGLPLSSPASHGPPFHTAARSQSRAPPAPHTPGKDGFHSVPNLKASQSGGGPINFASRGGVARRDADLKRFSYSRSWQVRLLPAVQTTSIVQNKIAQNESSWCAAVGPSQGHPPRHHFTSHNAALSAPLKTGLSRILPLTLRPAVFAPVPFCTRRATPPRSAGMEKSAAAD